jgi:hypothetical protein
MAATVARFLQQCLAASGLLAVFSKEQQASFRAGFEDLEKRGKLAAETMANISDEDERLEYGLAAFDGLSGELNKLIVEMRRASQRR